jgi:aspartyl protease family protein
MNSAVKSAIGIALGAFIAAQIAVRFLSPRARLEPAVQTTAAPAPASRPAALAPGRGSVTIPSDKMGQYFAEVEINGSRVHMLVDTGATSVALSYEDAAAVGFYPAPSEYRYAVSTANGTAKVARVKLGQIRLGSLTVYDVDALVGERGALSSSLLGMTFLSKLSRVEASAGKLVLTQ